MKKLGLLILLLGCPAFAQINCLKWVSSTGVIVGSAMCRSFSIKAGANIQFLNNGFGIVTIQGTGISAAAGSSTQLQFNTSGAMNGSAALTWDGSNLNATNFSGSNLTDQGFLFSDLQAGVDGVIKSTLAASNGQLLIGNTGNSPQLGSITGTANQVVVTNGAGTIGLSLPQSIGTGSSPTFSQLTTSGSSVIDGIETTTPSTPSSTHNFLYPKTGVGWCYLNSSGTEDCPRQELSATSASFSPGALTLGLCATQANTTVAGATTAMAAIVQPVSDPGGGLTWQAIITSGNVAVRVCNISSATVTPSATAYNIRVVK